MQVVVSHTERLLRGLLSLLGSPFWPVGLWRGLAHLWVKETDSNIRKMTISDIKIERIWNR
jgi:hypothetical protein